MIGNQVISTDFPVDYASGTGSQTAFTLSIAPASVNAVDVEVSGVSQSPQTYTISGTTLTFSAAPPSGTNNIVFKHRGIAGIPNTPSAGSVVPASLSTGGPSWDSAGALSVASTATVTADSSNANALNLRANAGDTYNQITFWNNSGSNSNAQIGVQKVGTNGGLVYFKYKPDGGSLTEGMRIDSSGRLFVNASATGPFFDGKSNFYGNSSIPAACFKNDGDGGQFTVSHWNAATSGTRIFTKFVLGSTPTEVGSITSTGSSTSYVTSSDYRLKENIAPMQNALNVVQQLKPVTYNWKADGSSGQGFIAHELQEVVPDCVVGEKDAVNEDGSIKSQGIDTSFLVATLTAAIQELKAQVDAQALEIQALKGTV